VKNLLKIKMLPLLDNNVAVGLFFLKSEHKYKIGNRDRISYDDIKSFSLRISDMKFELQTKEVDFSNKEKGFIWTGEIEDFRSFENYFMEKLSKKKNKKLKLKFSLKFKYENNGNLKEREISCDSNSLFLDEVPLIRNISLILKNNSKLKVNLFMERSDKEELNLEKYTNLKAIEFSKAEQRIKFLQNSIDFILTKINTLSNICIEDYIEEIELTKGIPNY